MVNYRNQIRNAALYREMPAVVNVHTWCGIPLGEGSCAAGDMVENYLDWYDELNNTDEVHQRTFLYLISEIIK